MTSGSTAGEKRGHERSAALCGLTLALLTAVAAQWAQRPPAPLPVSAPAERFAADRALVDVEALAGRPRPIGSAAHRRAREYLLARMSELGLSPEVQQITVAVDDGAGRIRAAHVRNLLGRSAGGGGSGAVLLAAHYDTRPNTPGAGDDASGVAVVLETVRALARGKPLERDLIVLLTDAEELGLLGARGFAAHHPWIDDAEVVLNFEARGSRGAVAMFETAAGDLELVRAFAVAAPYPLASSLSAAVYARMPNDTDFTVFRGAGLSGLNFAFLGGPTSYHSALDTAVRLDAASLQQAGDNAVALIRALGPPGGIERGATGVYFNALGWRLLVWPAAAALGGALAAALTVAALALTARRRRLLEWREMASGAALAAALPVLGALAAAVLWRLLAGAAPVLLDTPHRLPHRLELAGVALALAGLGGAAAVAGLRWRLRPVAAGLGAAATWAALALISCALLPGAAVLFLWPLVGLIPAAAVVVARGSRLPEAILVSSLGALPGVAMLAPLARLAFEALTPHLALAALMPAMLILPLVLPALISLAGGRQRLALAALAAALAALALAVAGTADGERPRTGDLVLLEELDEGSVRWLTRDRRPHPWIAERLGRAAEPWQPPEHLGLADEPMLRGERLEGGPSSAGPEVTRVEESRQGGRRLTLRIRSPAGAPRVRVLASSSVPVRAVEVAGERFERPVEEATDRAVLELAGLDTDGITVTLELPDRWPVEVQVTEQFYGLPSLPPMPPELIPNTGWTSHSRLVHRSFLR